ncbi:integrase catalytic domain-containing protein [Trichonephila clavipes]|nr:integrase catalytic domain-containing protein [Trichonephila clavipes]
MNADYWWKGPDWINNDLKEELASAKILTTCTVEADSVLNSIPLVVKSNPLEPIISKFSNFTKLIRVIALCKRFINNCKSGSKVKGQLKSEVESAHKFLVKTIQQAEYSQEISHLKYHKPIPRSSKLLSLNIFLEEDEILRVGGRLTKQPTLSFDQKFPIIIPKHHPITTLVIRQFHLRGFHSGTQMTLSLIRQHYWIPDGRLTVRREIKRCIENVVDLTLNNRTLKWEIYRNKESPKLAHLKSSQQLLETTLYASERALNTKSILQIEILDGNSYPYAPNFGGLWESSIKLAKRHLIKTCKGHLRSFEELSTLLCQIEACINYRPLVPLSSDPADIRALTPGHFLIGEPLLEIPESKSIINTSLSLSCRWKSLLKLRQHFWDRWHKEVLHHYQSRPKWKAS